MRYLFAVVFCVWFSGTLFAEESEATATPETKKSDCVFEVPPKQGADAEQLAVDLDAALAQFDDCLVTIKVGTLGKRQVGPHATSNAQGLGGTAISVNGDETKSGEDSSDLADEPSNGEGTIETEEDPINAVDSLLSQENKQSVLTTTDRRDNTKDVQNRLQEDDVAKLLREAAEKETDPNRKASLYKNYEDYMARRKK